MADIAEASVNASNKDNNACEANENIENASDDEQPKQVNKQMEATSTVLATNAEQPIASIESSVANEILVETVPLASTAAVQEHGVENVRIEQENGIEEKPSIVAGIIKSTNSTSHNVKEQQAESNFMSHVECMAKYENQRLHYEQQLEQLRVALAQKDNVIALFQRENGILEKEKQAFRKEKEYAMKEKESTVIKFAMQEKLLIDAKKSKEQIEKQLEQAKTEIKNVTTRFQALNEEKSRVSYVIDEKCNEVRKHQRECEKLKSEMSHLESKLKYHINRLNMETEAKAALEKKLEEERNAPNKMEEKANEKLKMEYEANTILLKHEIQSKTSQLDTLKKELKKANDTTKQLQEQLDAETTTHTQCIAELELLRHEHQSVETAYSEEMLNSAKLRTQLEALQVLKTQNALNEEKINNLNALVQEQKENLLDNQQDLEALHARELELLSINKEMSESIVHLQSEICMLRAKAHGLESDNELLKENNTTTDNKLSTLEQQLQLELTQKTEERQLLTKHLSEKTKLYEITKTKLENVMGDFEATQNKHNTIVKELQREILKYKKSLEQTRVNNNTNQASTTTKTITNSLCDHCHNALQNGYNSERSDGASTDRSSRRPSETSESETVISHSAAMHAMQNDIKGPSKKHLVERILRLQQASARQTEKIDFLENHTLALVAELQKKSKVVQYYMLRDQAGALTSTKSDQNKSELAKYGNGVMSAIYGGIKSENKSMTLELSLEINKKLQAVLEDTLLKNITLKENLDVLGLEVDNLTRKLRQLEARSNDSSAGDATSAE